MHHEDEYIENHHENLLMSLTNTDRQTHGTNRIYLHNLKSPQQ